MPEYMTFAFFLSILYMIIAILCFKLIKEPRNIFCFPKKIEYYLYFFEYICLFFSIFALISIVVAINTPEQILCIPLMHFICDSILYVFIQIRLNIFKSYTSTNNEKNRNISGFFMKLQVFLSDPLQIIHHILLIAIYILGIYEKNEYFYIIFVFLDEISIPFLLIKRQYKRKYEKIENSSIFSIIEVIFIVLYIISRGLLLPIFSIYLAFFIEKAFFFGPFLISLINWVNFFWVIQTICLIMKKIDNKEFIGAKDYLERYRKDISVKYKTHIVLFIWLVIVPAMIFIIK